MLIDSEDPVTNAEKTWEHLKKRDNRTQPQGASDEQVLFMTTCMETWIVADPGAMRLHYGHELQESALPALNDLERRNRHNVQQMLKHATRQCKNAYQKDKRSFRALAQLTPATLDQRLPSFKRLLRILNQRLGR
jgi:hypothetical protein